MSTELVWVTREGTVTAVDPGWPGEFHSLALSPDGTRLAVAVRRDPGVQVWVKRLDRGPASKLTFEGINIRPTWTADGRRVAFFSSQTFDMFVGPADGSSPAQLQRDEVGRGVEAEFSRDGEWLVYRDGDVHALRTRGDSARVDLVGLVGTPFDETTPAISSDGRWLAYVSEESGRHEVYVRPFPNTGSAKWQVSSNGGTEPVWARSGRELYFRNARDELVSAAVLPGETFEIGEQRVLFSTVPFLADPYSQVYDVTPDGQRFVMIRQAHAAGIPEELIVVENFFEELKGKVKRSRD